jgi:hypothetical protein
MQAIRAALSANEESVEFDSEREPDLRRLL